MRIEIDQSGKLENTNKPTVVAFSNGKAKTIIITATEKQKLQKYFRKINKRKIYVYKTLAIMIFILIRNEKNIDEIIIDREYSGQEPVIKNFLVNFIRQNRNIDKNTIHFKEITKNSNAHRTALKSFKNKKADLKINSNIILRYLNK